MSTFSSESSSACWTRAALPLCQENRFMVSITGILASILSSSADQRPCGNPSPPADGLRNGNFLFGPPNESPQRFLWVDAISCVFYYDSLTFLLKWCQFVSFGVEMTHSWPLPTRKRQFLRICLRPPVAIWEDFTRWSSYSRVLLQEGEKKTTSNRNLLLWLETLTDARNRISTFISFEEKNLDEKY